MEMIDTIMKGFILMAIYALVSSFTVTDMKNMAIKAHKQGPISYSAFTKSLTSK